MSKYQEDLQAVKVPQLEPLRGCHLLITGATGLVGSSLIDLLLRYADRYALTLYAGCRSREKFLRRFGGESRSLVFLEMDVTRPLTGDRRFDYIVHAASGAAPNAFAADPVGVMKANLFGTAHLLDYGLSHGLKRFLYISSGEVYGEGCPGKWTERDSGYVDSMKPRACYPASKRAAETLCAAYAKQYGVEAVVARLCHTYGPCFTETDNRVYAQFIRNVARGQDIVLKSQGAPYRSWLYVVDCVAALLFVLLQGKSGEVYNVANEESNISIRQLAETIARIAGRKVVFDLPPSEGQPTPPPITKAVFDTAKVEALGWAPAYSIEEGLSSTIASL